MTDAVVCRQKALRGLGDLPPFSPILNKLMASLASDDVSFGQLAELIEKDTVLAGNVLRLVNSALYGRRGTISSVRHAVSLIGLAKLRNTVMTLSVSRLWADARSPKGWPAARFNLHGVATAVMTDLLAQRLPAEFPEGGFVAGLLHDIGLLLIATSLPQEFAEIRRLHVEERMPVEEAERAVIGMDHADISAAALNRWNLPVSIQTAVRYQFEEQRMRHDEIPLSWLVRASSRLVEARGAFIFIAPPESESNPARILEAAGLRTDPDSLIEDFEREFEPIKGFF